MSEERVERGLAAILAADVAGYSRLMERDEVGTLARLRTLRRDLIEPRIVEHQGCVVKTTGDGLLIEFPSIVEEVACAVAVQRGMEERNATTPGDHPGRQGAQAPHRRQFGRRDRRSGRHLRRRRQCRGASRTPGRARRDLRQPRRARRGQWQASTQHAFISRQPPSLLSRADLPDLRANSPQKTASLDFSSRWGLERRPRQAARGGCNDEGPQPPRVLAGVVVV